MAYAKNNELKKAVDFFSGGMKLSKRDHNVWLFRGMLYCQLEDLTEAFNDIIRGVAMSIFNTKKLNSPIDDDNYDISINSIEKRVKRLMDEMEKETIPKFDGFEQLDMNSIVILDFYEEKHKNYFAQACICDLRLQKQPFNEDKIMNQKIQHIKKWCGIDHYQNQKNTDEVYNKALALLLMSGKNETHNFFQKRPALRIKVVL
ncbi:hypothetical protein BBD24_14775 (plasmid) [Lacticaseibacillus paracasei subsp. paracasei]|nr:hypothetical protein BBD24_14775 [Lacticaseibacillus paracasei subsp. paracasei]